MVYTVLISKTFQKSFLELSKSTQDRIRKNLYELKKDPATSRPQCDIKILHDTDPRKYRLRVGDYRIIYLIEDGIAVLKDIFSIEDEEVKMNLVSGWIHFMKDKDIYSMSATVLNSNKWIRILKNLGFVNRPADTSSVIVYPNNEYKFAKQLLNAENWYMTVGDRDV